MQCRTTRWYKVDGTQSRRYVCKLHRRRSQDCSRGPLDARVVDAAFIENLDSFLGDITGWRERLTLDRRTERDRMQSEIDRARSALDEPTGGSHFAPPSSTGGRTRRTRRERGSRSDR